MSSLTLQEETIMITWPTINIPLKMLIKRSRDFIVKTVLNNHRKERFSKRTIPTEREATMKSLEFPETQAFRRSRELTVNLHGSKDAEQKFT